MSRFALSPCLRVNPESVHVLTTVALVCQTKDKEREQANKAKASEVEHKKATADRTFSSKPMAERLFIDVHRSTVFAQVPQKIPFGVDPKSVVCQYHKAGFCEKGRKCKFSHDLNVNRKGEKADLYTDSRLDKKDDLMEYWDEAKLKEVVLSPSCFPILSSGLGLMRNHRCRQTWQPQINYRVCILFHPKGFLSLIQDDSFTQHW